MHRPRHATGFLLAPIVFMMFFLTTGCSGGGTEKTTIDKFFRASRLRDNVTTGMISMAQYNPQTEGQVESTSLVSMTEEQVAPLRLKELAQAVDEAKKADEEFTKRKMAYQDQHVEELNRWEAARKKGEVLKGRDSAFAAEWQKWVEETKVSSKKLSDAREALSHERGVADMSVANAQNPIDPTQYDGDVANKEYTIRAHVITPTGQRVTRTLVVTLQQARLKADPPINGKWIITKIRDVTAGGTTS